MKRLFGVELMHLSVLLLLPLLISELLHSPEKMFRDPDIWWHLANARILFTQHHFIWTEPYAYTVIGKPWQNPEWLAEAPYYLGFRWLGAFGIYLVACGVFFANVALAYLRSHRKAGPQAAFWACLGGLLLLSTNAGARTIQFGYVLLSLLLLLLDLYEEKRSGHEEKRSRTIWLVPALFCLWVNTHGSWLLGLIVFLLYLVPGFFRMSAGAIEQEKWTKAEQKTLLTVLSLSLAALFVNPYGWRLVWSPFDMIFNQKLNIAGVQEWQALSLEMFIGKVAAAVIFVFLAASFLKPRKWKLYEILFLVFAFYEAFDHVRFTCLAGVIVTPILAVELGRLVWTERDEKDYPWLNAAFAACAVLMLFFMAPSRKQDTDAMNTVWPDSLIGMVQPSWRTFNAYEVGGRFALAGKPDFVDSRVDTFEHAGVFGDYRDAVLIVKPFEVLDKYKIDHILFMEKTPLVYVVERSPQWAVVKREGDWVLLERKQ